MTRPARTAVAPVLPLRASTPKWTGIEFFAGIGLARAGMESAGIQTIWANDYDEHKRQMYVGHWGEGEYLLADVHTVDGNDIPTADVAWASSPCTDLSLAGTRAGLRGGRESSAFFGFTRALSEMGDRRPSVVVLENVNGLASSHGGADLRAACLEFNALGYAVDVVTLDTRRFLPQSRPRLFIIGARDPVDGGTHDTCTRPDWLSWVHADPEIKSFRMPDLAVPEMLSDGLTDEIEHLDADDPRWWDEGRVARFVSSMSPVQRDRLDSFRAGSKSVARTAYRRTRAGVAVWEMRGEDISGCLRTARGGSSKQAVVIMGNGKLQIRWMTGLEYARLMGAGWFTLNGLRDSQVQYGFGDAVSVPVVEWIAKNFISPILAAELPSVRKSVV